MSAGNIQTKTLYQAVAERARCCFQWDHRTNSLREGTDGAEEWIDDVVFIAEHLPQFPGRVECGFTDIYLSMEYRSIAGGPIVALADGIKDAVGGADVLKQRLRA